MTRFIRSNMILHLVFVSGICMLMLGLTSCARTESAEITNKIIPTAESKPAKITLNTEDFGTTADTSVLTKKLQEVFNEREKSGVFRGNSNEIEKGISISGNRLISAVDFMKLYSAVRKAGASPIKIPAFIPGKSDKDIKPNPLILLAFAGEGDSPSEPDGIEVSFVGTMLQTNDRSPLDKTKILIVVDKEGNYLIDGVNFSQTALETGIRNRLSNKPENEKVIFAQIDDTTKYGKLADIVAAAANAGSTKVYFITTNITATKQGISFSLPPTWYKDDETDSENSENEILFRGPDDIRFSINLDEQLKDEDPTDEIKHEYQIWSDSEDKIREKSLLEIDGSIGLLSMPIEKDSEGDLRGLSWLGFRKVNGKFQIVSFDFSCPLDEFKYRRYEFEHILRSIKFGKN